MMPFLKSLKLTNLLSFGPESEPIELRPLNVIIGPNGSGKSNLLEAINLLSHAPNKFSEPVRQGGGIQEWLWKGKERFPIAEISVDIAFPSFYMEDPIDCYEIQYSVSFEEQNASLSIRNETIEGKEIKYYGPIIEDRGEHPFERIERIILPFSQDPIKSISLNRELSILSTLRGYGSASLLSDAFSRIRLYKEWSFGGSNPARGHQRADMPNDYLEPDGSNLGLVLNTLRQNPDAKKRLLECLRVLYEGIEDVDIRISSGSVQVFLQENGRIIPATRLSDGTLRYLCLLAILCHPSPPLLVCIEEPELGLHPDILPTLADLLREASERCQLIVTTHSDMLVDALTETPEDILVCEKDPEKGTSLHRLNEDELKPWLEKYTLGQLWTRGDIGGKRW